MDETTKRLSCTSYLMQSYSSDDTNESQDQPQDDDKIVVARQDSRMHKQLPHPRLWDEPPLNKPGALEVEVVQVHIDASIPDLRKLLIHNY